MWDEKGFYSQIFLGKVLAKISTKKTVTSPMDVPIKRNSISRKNYKTLLQFNIK
jgi:hypothetical protein